MEDQLNYPLTSVNFVVEIGGWRGEWASKIAELYDPYITILEPIREYYEVCRDRFDRNPKITVIHAGLGARYAKSVISKMEEASSLFLDASTVEGEKFRTLRDTESIELLDAGEALRGPIDLLSLNCEGAEFLILPRLIDTGRIRDVVNVQIQFHRFVTGAGIHRDLIREKLALTHNESWCVPWGWESWRQR